VPHAVPPSPQLAIRRRRLYALPTAAYSQLVCIPASALTKEPLMTPSRRVMLSAFTTALADMTLSSTRSFLLMGEAARDMAP
jgi:hypothetical protein